jgi:low temperature requirement protein LtrA
VAIDYAGPAWLTRERLRSLQRVAVAHFAERYSLFVIICLGESIVAIGVGAVHTHQHHLGAQLVVIVALGLLITAAMWWTYFDSAPIAESRLRTHPDPVLAAADAYSYLHLVIVAGIIVFAAGVRHLVSALAHTPPASVRLALCAGIAAYLLGHVAFGWRMIGQVGYAKVVIVAALMILYAVSAGISAWALMALIAALLGVLGLIERLSLATRDATLPRI